MKFLKILIISSFMLLPAYAATSFAVVDYQRALQASKAFKSFQSQVQKYGEEINKEFSKERDDLEKVRTDLAAKRADYSQNDFDKRKNDLDKRVESFSKRYQTKQQNFDKVAADVVASIENQAKKVVADISKEKGYTVVMQAAALVTFPKDMDITDQVTKGLDKAMPSVVVKKP